MTLREFIHKWGSAPVALRTKEHKEEYFSNLDAKLKEFHCSPEGNYDDFAHKMLDERTYYLLNPNAYYEVVRYIHRDILPDDVPLIAEMVNRDPTKGWSDNELKIIVGYYTQSIEFLAAIDARKWYLALAELRHERDAFQAMIDTRKRA